MSKDMLNILWTNADPITAEMMVLMYAKASAARGWWKRVRVIVWGATADLVAQNPSIQALIRDAQQEGVEFSACEACADKLGVKQALLDMDIEVILWGDPLTTIIKNDEHLITI